MAGRPKRRARLAAGRKKNPGMPGSLRGAGALYVNPSRGGSYALGNPGPEEHERRAAHQQSLFDAAPARSRSRSYHEGARDAHRGVPRANPVIEATYPGPAYYDSIQGPIAVRILSRSGDTFRVRSEAKGGAWPKGYEWDVKVRDTFPRKALGGKYGTRIKPYTWKAR